VNCKNLIGPFLFLCMLTLGNLSSQAASLESLLPSKLPEGWRLIDGPHPYNRKTLFKHVNGQAELYLKYGYQGSVFAAYQHTEKPERQIEIDIYDMGSVLQAFGIFSRSRTEDPPGGIGLDSCVDDRSFLFYKGRYYVMLSANEPDLFTMKALALSVSTGISDPSPSPKEIRFFPTRNLKPGSVQYFSEGLLGHRFLQRGFQGTYLERETSEVKAKAEAKAETGKEKREFYLFLAIFKNGEETKSAFVSYREYLAKKGKIRVKIPADFGPHTLAGEDPYKGRILVVQKGVHLIGIAGFERETEARECLAEAIKSVK
jgi:hypothetical protein